MSVRHVPLLEINFLIDHFNVSILIRNFLNPFPRTADCHVKQAACAVKLLHPLRYARFVSITKRYEEHKDRKEGGFVG